MIYCEVCKKDLNIFTKPSHIKSDTHKEKEVFSRKNNTLAGEIYTYLNPQFDQVDDSLKGASNDRTKYLHRFKHKCVFFIIFFINYMERHLNLRYQTNIKSTRGGERSNTNK